MNRGPQATQITLLSIETQSLLSSSLVKLYALYRREIPED